MRASDAGSPDMDHQFLMAAVLLGAAAALIFVGLPNQAGESPRFLQFEAATMLYSSLILLPLVFGTAALISGLFNLLH